MNRQNEPAAEWLEVGDLTPWADNPRSNDHAVGQVAKSIERFGFAAPIVARRDGAGLEVVAGHTRLKAAHKLGLDRVPVRVLDLDPADARLLALADNRLGELADWSDDLGDLMQRLDDEGLDLGGLGWSDEELAALLAPEAIEADGTEDDVPEVQEEVHSQLGEVYELGPHRLACGDCVGGALPASMGNEKAAAMFADPPYGYRYESNYQTRHAMLANDDKIQPFLGVVRPYMMQDCAVYVCASHQTYPEWRRMVEDSFTYKNTIIWKKNNWSMGDLCGAFAGQYEMILFAHHGRVALRGGRPRDVWEFDRHPPTDHPTQKPVDLVSFALRSASDASDVILDPFAGSGTTLIACAMTNRTARLVELDPRYCDVIRRRWTTWAKKHNQDPGAGALE